MTDATSKTRTEAKDVAGRLRRIHDMAKTTLEAFSAFTQAQQALCAELVEYCADDAHLSLAAAKYSTALTPSVMLEMRASLSDGLIAETSKLLSKVQRGDEAQAQYDKVRAQYESLKAKVASSKADANEKAFVKRYETTESVLQADIDRNFEQVLQQRWRVMDTVLYQMVESQAAFYAGAARSLRDVAAFCTSHAFLNSMYNADDNAELFPSSLAAVLTDPVALEAFRLFLRERAKETVLATFVAANALYRQPDTPAKRSSTMRFFGALSREASLGISPVLQAELGKQARARQFSNDLLNRARASLFAVLQKVHFPLFVQSYYFTRMQARWRRAADFGGFVAAQRRTEQADGKKDGDDKKEGGDGGGGDDAAKAADDDARLSRRQSGGVAAGMGGRRSRDGKEKDSQTQVMMSAATRAFRLKIESRVTGEFSATWKSNDGVTYPGMCFVLGGFGLIFFSRIFGLTKTEKIQFSDVQDVVADQRKQLRIMTPKATYLFQTSEVDAAQAAEMIAKQRFGEGGGDGKKRGQMTLKREESTIALVDSATSSGATGGAVARVNEDDMTESDWHTLLQAAPLMRYTSGTVIITEGEPQASLYQICDGSVRVLKGDTQVGSIPAGEVFGEMSFLTGGTATATIVADVNAQVYVLRVADVRELFQVHPDIEGRFYFYLAQVVAVRLRERTELVRKKKAAAADESALKLEDADHTALTSLLLQGGCTIALALCLMSSSGDRDAIARALVDLFDYKQFIYPLCETSIAFEVENTRELGTLFRGNSMSIKILSTFGRLYSAPYLKAVLAEPLKGLADADVSYEIDPNKASEDDNIETNRARLTAVCQDILDRVLGSVDKCPLELCRVCYVVRTEVRKKFPEERLSIGAFFFLRTLNPAIVSPSNNGVLEDPLSGPGFRAAVLVSKVLQNLANNVKFGGKEPYMESFNKFIDANLGRLQDFFAALAKRGEQLDATGAPQPTTTSVKALDATHHLRDFLERYRRKIEQSPEVQANSLQLLVVQTSLDAALQKLKVYSKTGGGAVKKGGAAGKGAAGGGGKAAAAATMKRGAAEKSVIGAGDEKATLEMFGLGMEEVVSWYDKCKLRQGKVSLSGKLYFSTRHAAFQSKVFGYKKSIVISLVRVQQVKKSKDDGIELVQANQPDVRFVLSKARDQAYGQLAKAVAQAKATEGATEAAAAATKDAELNAMRRDTISDGGDGGMTPTDWMTLMEGAKLQTIAAGSLLIEEGQMLPGIYQTSKGHVEVVVGGVTVATIPPGFILGEISFLEEGSGASATIRARDEVEVYLLERTFVKDCLKQNPAMKSKLYVYLSSLMIDRMRKL